MTLTIDVSDESVRLETEGRVAVVSQLDDESPAGVVRSLLASYTGEAPIPTVWRLRFGYPWAQIRTVRGLPPVRERILSRIVEERAAIIFRGSPEGLAFDATWENQEDGVALAVAVDDPLLQELVLLAKTSSAVVEYVSVTGLAAERSAFFQDSTLRRHERSWLARRLFKALSLATLPWLTAFALFTVDMVQDAGRLGLVLDSLQSAETRLARIEQSIHEAAFVVERLQQPAERKAFWLSQISDLSALLPPDRSVSRLHLGPDRQHLVVEALDSLDATTSASIGAAFPGWRSSSSRIDPISPNGGER